MAILIILFVQKHASKSPIIVQHSSQEYNQLLKKPVI